MDVGINKKIPTSGIGYVAAAEQSPPRKQDNQPRILEDYGDSTIQTRPQCIR